MDILRSNKARRPMTHHSVLRKNIIEQLSHASAKPVIAVLAPPGYGKTTFVSSYIESKQQTSVWYCVDEGDADLASFFDTFSHAVKKVSPICSNPIPTYQRENALNITVFARHYFTAAYQRLGPVFNIVFDDIHTCQSQRWADVVTVAISELPINCQIFLVGRQGLQPELARLQINQQVHTLREEDLRFNDDELLELASTHKINALTVKQRNKIQATMVGWGAGLTLLFTRMNQLNNDSIFELDTKQDVFNYFMNEVLRHIDADACNVLFCTCFLSDVSVDHAMRLSKNEVAGNILQALYRQNYFIYCIPGSAVVYRYHPLFKTFLMEQSQKKLSNQDLCEIQESSATLLENNGDIIAAASLLIEIKNESRLIEFTLKHAQKLVLENHILTLTNWLRHIPVASIESSGWLLYWRGICGVATRPPMARKDFINAFKIFKSYSDATGQCLSISGIIDSYMFVRDDFSPLDPWIEEVDNNQLIFAQHATPQAMNLLTVSMFSSLLHRAPHYHNFAFWLDRINAIPMSELPPGLRIRKQLSIILHYIWQGDFRRAKIAHSLLEKQLANCPEPIPLTLWHTIHCVFLWSIGDAQRGLDVAKSGLRLAKEYGLELWNIGLTSHGAAAALMIHNSDEANQFLDATALQVTESGHTHMCFFHVLKAVQSFRNKMIDEVSYHGQEALSCANVSGLPFLQASAHFTQAQCLFVTGDTKKARHHNLMCKQIGITMHSYFHQFQSLLFEAILDWSVERRELALKSLIEALDFAKKYDLITGLWICETELTQILVEAMRHNIGSAVACQIVAKRHLTPAEPPYDIAAWPWPVHIQTLGRFEIKINGQALAPPSRSRPKLFALLKVLIAFGGSQVREELITETVWPDAEGDAAHQLFDTTLFRLRKFLGIPGILINHDGKLSLNKRMCWLDIWAIDTNTTKLNSLIKSKRVPVNQIKQLYEQANNIFHGDFLMMDDDFPVITQQRQQIRLQWIRTLYLVVDSYLQSNEAQEAQACLETLIKHNPLEERAYCMLMNLYFSCGQYAKCAVVYESCKRTLQTSLGVKPSIETELLYNKIQAFASPET